MYQNKYFVTKTSGTYAETLETYGLAKILFYIFNKNKIYNANIRIKDKGAYYSVSSDIGITEDMVNKTSYFDAIPYIKTKKDRNENLPGWVIDYESEKNKRDVFKKRLNEIYNVKDEHKRAKLLSELSGSEDKPHSHFNIFLKVRDPKNIKEYNNILLSVFKNKKNSNFILKRILSLYSNLVNDDKIVENKIKKWAKENKIVLKEEFSALQIFNPHQGKGVNRLKSDSIKLDNLKSFWLKEYLKMIGIYESMIIKDVKVSNRSWDTKYYVIDPFDIKYSRLSQIYKQFKPLVKGNTPFKMDILSILYYTRKLIEFIPEYQEGKASFSRRFKPSNLVQGFKTAYQKNMGQNKSIANIGYLRLPEFIEIGSYEEGQKWITILDEHIGIIKNIDENNSSTTSLLQHYRQFISAGDWNEFFEFYFDYVVLLMIDIGKRKMYLKAFSIKNLKEVFMTEKEFKPILESRGFQNVAKAIRNATIGAQYAKARGNQLFDIHYGMAQDLKRKSPYKAELVEYLSEFIAFYNAETAKYVEHHPNEFNSGKVRATIKMEDIKEIVELIDNYGSSVVGKLLTAYGYALERKEGALKSDNNKKIDQGGNNDGKKDD